MTRPHFCHIGNPSRRGWGQEKSLAWLAAFGLLSATAQCHAQGSFQITFDGDPVQPPGTSYFVQQYFESGAWFRPLGVIGPGNGFSRRGGGSPSFIPDNGTAYIATAFGDSLQFSFLHGSPFSLVSVDLAEYSTTVPNAVTVPFVGYRSDGSVVNASFTTDGIIDGTGPIADFQTFHFCPQFSNLTRVEIPTYGWSLDNLVVVPEPGMSIYRSPTNVVVSWSPTWPGIVLESSPTLTPPEWQPVSTNGTNSLSFPISGPSRFFRLNLDALRGLCYAPE